VPRSFDPSGNPRDGQRDGRAAVQGDAEAPRLACEIYKLPKPPEGQDDLVVAPAEVEM
jgi:hypothetical protein